MERMDARLVIVDGYNVILRSSRLKPGPDRTLRESRDMLVNLLAWMMGGNNVRFLVVFDGSTEGPGRDVTTGRVLITYSRPPETADDVIRRYVEKWIGGDEHITVVTSDLEVARHARAMGADISLGDLFLASAFPTRPATADGKGAEDDKPVSLSRKELEEWSELFVRRSSKPASSESKDAEDDDDDA
jgi:predicted RNA-binding protein with PIN domain